MANLFSVATKQKIKLTMAPRAILNPRTPKAFLKHQHQRGVILTPHCFAYNSTNYKWFLSVYNLCCASFVCVELYRNPMTHT